MVIYIFYSNLYEGPLIHISLVEKASWVTRFQIGYRGYSVYPIADECRETKNSSLESWGYKYIDRFGLKSLCSLIHNGIQMKICSGSRWLGQM